MNYSISKQLIDTFNILYYTFLMLTIFCSISGTPRNKTPKVIMDHLHEFIGELQVHPSHYTRGKAPLRQYMDQHCSIVSLYEGFAAKASALNIGIVRLDKFRRLFNDHYNIVPW